MLNEIDIKDAESQIKEIFQKFDRINRPYIVFCHPDDRKLVEKIKDIAVIEESYYLTPGKILAANRASFEDYYMNYFNEFVNVREIER